MMLNETSYFAVSPRNRVVVTGLGVITANARDISTFAEALRSGTSGLRRIDNVEMADFVTDRGGEIPKEYLPAEVLNSGLDRAIKLASSAAGQAMADAELQLLTREQGRRAALALGSSLGGWTNYLRDIRSDLEGTETPAAVRTESLMNVPPCRIAARIAQQFGIRGGHATTATACAAGANAIALGVDMIRTGKRDVVLTCATDPLSEISLSGFNALMALSPTINRPFDRDRDGIAIGEAAGGMVLESLEHALARKAHIYCEIPGYGLSSDAYHPTRPDPKAGGACRAIRRALHDASLVPDDIGYINAHGTGTQYNDLMELEAIKQIYGDRASQLPISSVKSMIGHTLGAAGLVESVATVLAMHGKFFPPTVHFETPMQGYEFDFVPEPRSGVDCKTMSSHSFGFGGNAACVLFTRV